MKNDLGIAIRTLGEEQQKSKADSRAPSQEGKEKGTPFTDAEKLIKFDTRRSTSM
jgi:hypothetical protein